MVELSILVPNWNTRDNLRSCLKSIRETVGDISHEVIVVDNCSCDGSAGMVRSEFPEARLIGNDSNRGFSKAVNQAIRASCASWVLLLNSDITLCPRAVPTLLELMKKDKTIGLLAGQLLNPDGSVQYFCRRFPTMLTAFFENTFLQRLFPHNKILANFLMKEWKHDDFREVDQPPGCFWFLRRSVIDTVGLLDEKMFLFYSDVDFCLRMRKQGLRICFSPAAKAIHGLGVTIKKLVSSNPRAEFLWHKDRFYYFRKHFGIFLLLLYKTILAIDFASRTVESLIYVLIGSMPFRQWRKQTFRLCIIITR